MAAKVKVRGRFDRVRRFTRMAEDVPVKSLTKQEFKEECDMNVIVRRAMKGQAPRFLNDAVPSYMDVSDVPSLADAYDRIEAAEEAFMTLPAELRRELRNDPRELENLTKEQIARYGLGKAPVSPPDASGGRGEPEGGTPSESSPKGEKPAQKSGASKSSGQE